MCVCVDIFRDDATDREYVHAHTHSLSLSHTHTRGVDVEDATESADVQSNGALYTARIITVFPRRYAQALAFSVVFVICVCVMYVCMYVCR